MRQLLFCRATGATLYHGSTAELAELSPRPSAVLDGESAVFATPNKDDALMFIGKWTGCDISYGTYGGEPYAIELNPEAFRALQTPGWLYTVDARVWSRPEARARN